MTLPNFFIIGAPKAGTTSLYYYLKNHPQIFLSSLKESYFFCTDKYKKTECLQEFESLFNGVEDEKAIGEACANYIFSRDAFKNISDILPHSKLILILRDPAQRAFSEYLMNYRTGYVKMDDGEENAEQSFFGYLEKEDSSYFYAENIKRCLQFFDKGQLKIILFEDLKKNARGVVEECVEFLGLDPTVEFELSTKIYNKGGMPKNTKVFLVLESLRRSYRKYLVNALPDSFYSGLRSIYSIVRSMNMQAGSPRLSKEGRRKLIDIHREDVLKLQDLIDRDLSAWLKI